MGHIPNSSINGAHAPHGAERIKQNEKIRSKTFYRHQRRTNNRRRCNFPPRNSDRRNNKRSSQKSRFNRHYGGLKMTQVTIKFEVPERIYDQYEGTLQEFLNYLGDLNINNVEVTEA